MAFMGSKMGRRISGRYFLLLFWMTSIFLSRWGNYFLIKRSFPSPLAIILKNYSNLPKSKFTLNSAGYCVKKEGSTAKYGRCGEDSYTISNAFELPTKITILAVADGVGGWIDHGGDSSQVSNGLMAAVKHFHRQQQTWNSLTDLIKQSFRHLVSLRRMKMGTTTVCSAAFNHETGELEVANIGDSQLLVIRNGEVILEVEAGVWAFNSPNQIGFGLYGEPQGDINEMVIEKHLQLEKGDIIVVGTDGLFDNIFVDDIAQVVSDSLTKSADLKQAVKLLAKIAYKNGRDDDFVSPFAQEAINAGKASPDYCGGKPDDISIILAVVS